MDLWIQMVNINAWPSLQHHGKIPPVVCHVHSIDQWFQTCWPQTPGERGRRVITRGIWIHTHIQHELNVESNSKLKLSLLKSNFQSLKATSHVTNKQINTHPVGCINNMSPSYRYYYFYIICTSICYYTTQIHVNVFRNSVSPVIPKSTNYVLRLLSCGNPRNFLTLQRNPYTAYGRKEPLPHGTTSTDYDCWFSIIQITVVIQSLYNLEKERAYFVVIKRHYVTCKWIFWYQGKKILITIWLPYFPLKPCLFTVYNSLWDDAAFHEVVQNYNGLTPCSRVLKITVP
jgi:hypothetical protein